MAKKPKTESELIQIHRGLVSRHLTQQTNFSLKAKRLTLKLYDVCIDHDNIKNFYFRSVNLFIIALITDRLDEISDYIERPQLEMVE